MRLHDDDIATLTQWAADDRAARFHGTTASPLLPVFYWVLIDNGFFWSEDTWWQFLIAFYIGLFLHVYVLSGLALWAPGPGAPDRILEGADPSVVLEASVHRVDGDRPYQVSLKFAEPARPPYPYVHVSASLGLELGERVVAYGFGTARNPFRRGVLVWSQNGQRHWVRSVLWSGSDRYVEPTD